MRKKEHALFESYGGRLTEQEGAWLFWFAAWFGGASVPLILSTPILYVAHEARGLAGAFVALAILVAVYAVFAVASLRNLRRVTSSLAQRHGLDPKAARKIEFRKGLAKFDETLAEAKRRSAPESR